MKTAIEYLNECAEVQRQRGEQYGKREVKERSFSAVATVFNAKTGYDLKGHHICLILQDLKDVRQYSCPDRFHEDSAVDKVSYASLHAEELNKEFNKEN